MFTTFSKSRLTKILVPAFSILFLASCTQYKYNVTYEKCNGQTGSISYTVEDKPFSRYYYNYNHPFKKQDGSLYTKGGTFGNVCDFSYTSNPLQ